MTAGQRYQLIDWLNGPEGCNFRAEPEGSEHYVWDCDGKHTLTRRWLEEHGLTVESEMEALRHMGGHCDCEVVFNCDDRPDEEEED